MSVENIVDYVMKTPQNTNKMVLKGMLESEIEKCSGTRWARYTKGEQYEETPGDETTYAHVSDQYARKSELDKGTLVVILGIHTGAVITFGHDFVWYEEAVGDGFIAMLASENGLADYPLCFVADPAGAAAAGMKPGITISKYWGSEETTQYFLAWGE